MKYDVVKKTVYDKLVPKVNNVDTNNFVLKTDFITKFTRLENKIPNTSGLVKKTDYNNKITEVENKIPDINGLATKTALTAVENKIPSISNLATKTALTTVENKIPSISGLVKKIDYNIKIADINPELNYYGTKTEIKFTRSSLKQSRHIPPHKKVVNIYIVYELEASSSHDSDPAIKNCLFGAVTLTKNADIEKYRYSGYGIGFDRRSSFSFPSVGFVKTC